MILLIHLILVPIIFIATIDIAKYNFSRADLTVSPCCLLPLSQGFVDDHGALEGTGGAHVAVNVRRGGDVAVAEPLLD